MSEVYLINPNYIKSTSNVSDNLDDKYMVSAIKEAQEIDLIQILGEQLLNKLKELISEDELKDEGNEVYDDLVHQCQYYLCYNVLSKLCMLTSFKINNIGVNQTSDDRVTNLTMNDTLKLENYYQKKVDFFCERLQNFILNNHSNLPELCECQCNKIKSNLHSSATTNIWLGGDRGQIRNPKKCRK